MSLLRFRANTEGSRRYETYQGRQFLVVPVVMMVEGVHNGSGGPTLYTQDQLRQFPEAWNGRPVPIYHPEVNGQFVSCNDPRILEQWTVGQLFNTRFSDGRLRSEAWIDVEKCRTISPSTLEMLERGDAMDVSTGVFSEDIAVQGSWNGEAYSAIASNIRPDHLALLPGSVGACSWADGCGVRANKEADMPNQQGGSPRQEKWAALAVLEQSFEDISRKIQTSLDALDVNGVSGTKFHFLEGVFTDHFIYRVRTRDAEQKFLGESFFKQNYSVSNDDSITFSGDPVAVRREVNYPTVQSEEGADEAGKDNPVTVHAKEDPMKVNAEVKKMVDGLIKNEASGFTEEDREILEGYSPCVLQKMVTLAEGTARAKELEAQMKAPTPTAEPKVQSEQAPGDVITVSSDQLQKMIQAGIVANAEQEEAKTIITALAQAKCGLTDDELKALGLPALRALSKAFPGPDYSGRGGSLHTHAPASGPGPTPPVVMAEDAPASK